MSVFLNLYKIAQKRQEKSADSQRKAHENERKKEVEQCTFKPDFSKTHKLTKAYLEKRSQHIESMGRNTSALGSKLNSKSNKENVQANKLKIKKSSFINKK